MSASGLFDSDAVRANQQGELTSEQKKAYANALTSGSGGCLILVLAAVIMVPIVLVFGKQLAALQGAAQLIGFAVILIVIVVAALIVNAIYSIPARLRASSAHVEQKHGQVTFEHGQYTPVADGHPLRSIYGDGGHLLPGRYSFYIVSGTNWLIALEKLADEASASAMPAGFDPSAINLNRVPEQYREVASAMLNQRMGEIKSRRSFDVNGLQAALSTTVGFDQPELDLNRQGKLAPRQLARLRSQRGSNLRWALLIAAFVIAFLAYVLVYTPAKIDLGGLVVVVAFFGALALALFWSGRRDNADVRAGKVEMTEGMVRKYTTSTHGGRGGSHTHYHFGVNQLHFEVSANAYNALIDNVSYRLYYTPTSSQLMSIEPIP